MAFFEADLWGFGVFYAAILSPVEVSIQLNNLKKRSKI
jgi:cellobiose-specific phosphotransferase system component IIC